MIHAIHTVTILNYRWLVWIVCACRKITGGFLSTLVDHAHLAKLSGAIMPTYINMSRSGRGSMSIEI